MSIAFGTPATSPADRPSPFIALGLTATALAAASIAGLWYWGNRKVPLLAPSHNNFTHSLPTSGAYGIELVAGTSSDLVLIYPGSSINYFGESLSKSANHAKILESRVGAGSVILGAAKKDSSVSVLLSSESLLSLLPTLYTISSEKLPVVFHVSCRHVDDKNATHSDYSSVSLASNTGFVLLSSETPQEAHHLALLSHLASIRTGAPVLHFFDSLEITDSISLVNHLTVGELKSLVSDDDLLYKQSEKHGVYSPDRIYDEIDTLMGELADKLGHRYKPFEYIGSPDATHVVVSMGSYSTSLEEVVNYMQDKGEKVGLLKVRLYRPWSASHFVEALPKSVSKVTVLEQIATQGSRNPLFTDVSTSTQIQKRINPQIISGNIDTPIFTTGMAAAVYENMKSDNIKTRFTIGNDTENSLEYTSFIQLSTDANQFSVWSTDGPSNAQFIEDLGKLLGIGNKNLKSKSFYDTYCALGSTNTLIVRGQNQKLNYKQHDYVAVYNSKFLKEYNLLENAKENAFVLLNGDWKDFAALENYLPASVKRTIAGKKLQVKTIDTKSLLDKLNGHESDLANSIVLYAALFTAFNLDLNELRSYILKYHLAHFKQLNAVIQLASSNVITQDIPDSWTTTTDEEEQPLSLFVENSLLPLSAYQRKNKGKNRNVNLPTYHATLHLLFPDVYQTHKILRPSLSGHGEIFKIKLTKTVRLTPTDYDRNIFHMEMDISGTGLKYDMGEALAVYGHNQTELVEQFLTWYKLNPRSLVKVAQKSGQNYEIRTVFQLFQQSLDIFGRPNKKFYQSLAEFAKDSKERQKLLFIASEEGKEEFKRRVEETTTFADLLNEFPSAHPTLDDLVDLIPPMKPRHYSIASSMKMCPTSVHLLVVVEDWKTPSGKYRMGQCSGYLSRLQNPETQDIFLTVGVAPSLMKLPPKSSQPIIMAGLGTGMAPFRAFVQERAYLASKGEKVGPMALYFGSRHRAKEYLYGEELEAYNTSGLLTYLRLAFSRDQEMKVYIQHKLNDDSNVLHDFLLNQDGHFYLCGPTWPAGDVYDAIVSSFKSAGKMDDETAKQTVFNLKETGRYVLEVY